MNRTAIQYDDNVYFARSETVVTWTDDDGVQWVSFVPTNGYNPGRVHRVRTDRVVIVELDRKPAPDLMGFSADQLWAHLKDSHGYMDGDLMDKSFEQADRLHRDQEPHVHVEVNEEEMFHRNVRRAAEAREAQDRVSHTVDVVDYKSFAECAREAGLNTLLVSDGEPPTAKVTGPTATVESFLQAAGYEKDDVR